MRRAIYYVFLAVLVSLEASAQFRPSKEWRTINTDIYELSVQKNGRTDLKSVSGIALYENAFPAVRYADDAEIEQLPVRAVYSSRQEVKDRLGSGQGLALRYEECEWQLRAYPTKPYLAVQVIYHNTRKKPVRIAELLPWCVGEPNRGSVWLGVDAAATRILQPGGPSEIVQGAARGRSHVAAFNPVSGRNLIAGFLSSERAWTEVTMSRSVDAAADRFDAFRAICSYDPPVELAPGESLASEVFYIAVGEQDPLFGLRRYGKAVAVWNGVRDARPFAPHGLWIEATSTEKTIGAIKAFAGSDRSTGMSHVTIGLGWEEAGLDMKAIADAAHAARLTIGLEIRPFAIAADSSLAGENPEWVVPVESDDTELALDITAPGAAAHVVSLAQQIGSAWGYDAVVDVDSARLLLDVTRLRDAKVTKVEAFRSALFALREGLGADKVLVAGGPAEISGTIADVVRTDLGIASDSMQQAVNGFYWTPSLFLAEPVVHTTADAGQRRSDYVLISLLGGVIGIQESDLAESDWFSALVPVASRPAIPLNFFRSNGPDVYHQPFEGDAGEWHTVGLFQTNADAAQDSVVSVDARRLGLAAEQYFTVYDQQAQHYHGLAQGRVEVRVLPGEHRILGLRPYRNRPMLLALASSLHMGAIEHMRIDWNPASSTLEGDFDAEKDTPYSMTFLVPEGWDVTAASVNGAPVEWELENRIIRMGWKSMVASDVNWRLEFAALGNN